MSEIDNTEGLILWGLIYSDEFCRKVIPFLKKEYFQDEHYKVIFEKVDNYLTKYNTLPTKEAVIIDIESEKGVSDEVYNDCITTLNELHLEKDRSENIEYLSDLAEKWVQDSAFFNVLMEATEVVDGDKDKVSKSGIPDKMSEALAISFDNSIGHDYFEDVESRYDYMHLKETKVSFGLEMFNKITKGGVNKKTLSVLMSTNTGGFKSGSMCSMAADNMRNGDDVLYITCELAEEVVSGRVDANLLDLDLDDIPKLGKATYLKNIEKARKKCPGKLRVKEYPTSTAHSGHFRFLLKELKQKHNFVPKIIYIDYLNICASQRLPPAAIANSYLYIKTIAEELRALAVEFELPIISATQGGRQVANSSNIETADVSESYGLPATVDMLIGVVTTEELDEQKMIMFKQLKNRFGALEINRTFMVGANKARMQLFDVPNNNSPSAAVTSGTVPQLIQSVSTESKFDSFQI